MPNVIPNFICPKCEAHTPGHIVFSSLKDVAFIKCGKCGHISLLEVAVGWELDESEVSNAK